jgi:hypothetical protein
MVAPLQSWTAAPAAADGADQSMDPGEPEIPPPHRPVPDVPITHPLPDQPPTPLLPETPSEPTIEPPAPPAPQPGPLTA